MTENLYRGKALDGGEWVEGSLIVHPFTSWAAIVMWDQKTLAFEIVEVDPDTVGQYVGREDCEGWGIFEGDKLEVSRSGAKWPCVVENIRELPWQIYGENAEQVRIIGNIYDDIDLR